jgi:hypothetical protein
MNKNVFSWLVYGALLLCLTAIGVEAMAWLMTPAWPGYMLRPAPISVDALASWHAGMPEVPYVTNRWLMRDRERSLAKPADVSFRSVFIGDSFLEGGFTRAALPSRVEGMLVEARQEGVEAINLGVAGTGPEEYYYRIRDVGLKLAPDAIVLTFYSGNDFVSEPFPERPGLPPLVAELPRPSILGSVAPHLAWQVVNALRLSGAARGGKYAPNEKEIIADALRRPAAEGVPLLAQFMHRYYFPELDERTVQEILGRGGDRFWSEFAPRRFDREYLQGWILYGLISAEVSKRQLPLTPAAAASSVPTEVIGTTLSWLVATDRLVRSHGAKFLIATLPVGDVDPDFVEFWRPWPRYYSATLQQGALHRAMAAAIAKTDLPVVDLARDLDGVRGTYRKSDLHWTERGHEVVAARLATEVMALRR